MNTQVTVSTYNVLHPYPLNNFNFLDNSGQDWLSRVNDIATNIIKSDSDVVCLQEIDQNNLNILQNILHSWGYSGYLTDNNGTNAQPKQDSVAILYKTKRF